MQDNFIKSQNENNGYKSEIEKLKADLQEKNNDDFHNIKNIIDLQDNVAASIKEIERLESLNNTYVQQAQGQKKLIEDAKKDAQEAHNELAAKNKQIEELKERLDIPHGSHIKYEVIDGELKEEIKLLKFN